MNQRINLLLRNSIYGFILGDALGVPYEFKQRGTFKCETMIGYGTHNQPAGTWSDDSALLLATLHSIKENNLKVNIDDMKNKYLSWLNEGRYSTDGIVFDIGIATRNALLTNTPQTSEYSNGNGSLMRILPLAFIDCNEKEIEAVSEITHGHHISKEACKIFINIIKQYLNQDPSSPSYKSLPKIIRNLPKYPEPFNRLYYLNKLKEKDIKSTGYVVDTLEAALWCILDNEKDNNPSFENCLLKAVNLGEDTDTVAAITGGLAGLIYSIDEMPKQWLDTLRNKTFIDECLW